MVVALLVSLVLGAWNGFLVSFVGILLWTWPNPPWTLLQWGSAAMMVALPLLFLRHARVLSLALDLLMRPPERRELKRPPDPRLAH